MHAAGAEIIGVQARAGDALVKLHQPLALLEAPQKRRDRSDIEAEGADAEQMVQDPGDLGERTRMYCARGGGVIPISFSTASAKACSWHIGET